jgi:hypothetical protein
VCNSESPSPAASGLLEGYRVVSERRAGNFDLQWRAPSLGLSAQAFLFLALIEDRFHPIEQLVIGVLILVVGGISIMVMLRADVRQLLDGFVMDHYEEVIFKDAPELRQHHSDNFQDRVDHILVSAGFELAIDSKYTKEILRPGKDTPSSAIGALAKARNELLLVTQPPKSERVTSYVAPWLRYWVSRQIVMPSVRKYAASRYWEIGLAALGLTGLAFGIAAAIY